MADLRNTRLSTAARNAGNDAICALANGGKLQIYDGTQPAAGGAVTTQTKLWEGTFANPAFSASSGGSSSLATAVTGTILADGTATWYRVLSSGSAIEWDGNVGDDTDSDTNNLELSNNVLGAGNTLTVSTFTFSLAAQGV